MKTAELTGLLSEPQVSAHHLKDDGSIPNNARLPLLISFMCGGPTWRFRVECRDHLAGWTAELVDDFKRLLEAIDGMTGARLEELKTPDEQVMRLLGAN